MAKMKTPKEKIVVIYHGDCPDGFGGAWAARKKFGKKAAYIAATDRFELPCPLKKKEIYLIDYTYKADMVKRLIKDNIRVTAIDHHVTAEDAVKLTQNYSFAIKNSGAVLAWQYFHSGKKIPFLLRCVEDRDIWNWKVPHAKELLSVVDLAPYDFPAWSKLAKDFENAKKKKIYIERGTYLLHYKNSLQTKLIGSVESVSFVGYKVLALNAPYYFSSDLGNILTGKKSPFAIIWSESAGRIRVSLRSKNAPGAIDVAKIAARFNGGGHKRASGFSFPVGEKFPWKLIVEK